MRACVRACALRRVRVNERTATRENNARQIPCKEKRYNPDQHVGLHTNALHIAEKMSINHAALTRDTPRFPNVSISDRIGFGAEVFGDFTHEDFTLGGTVGGSPTSPLQGSVSDVEDGGPRSPLGGSSGGSRRGSQGRRPREKLEHSHARIDSFRAFASPVYICLTNHDPILLAFNCSHQADNLAKEEPVFKVRGSQHNFAFFFRGGGWF